MNNIYKILLLIFITINVGHALVLRDGAGNSFDVDGFIANSATTLFREGCIRYYTSQTEFEVWAKLSKLKVYPDFTTSMFIGASEGRVYSATFYAPEKEISVELILAAESGNRCSVFIKEIDLEKAEKEFTKLRRELTTSEISVNISYETKKLKDEPIKTSMFKFIRNDVLYMTLETFASKSVTQNFDFEMRASLMDREKQ